MRKINQRGNSPVSFVLNLISVHRQYKIIPIGPVFSLFFGGGGRGTVLLFLFLKIQLILASWIGGRQRLKRKLSRMLRFVKKRMSLISK